MNDFHLVDFDDRVWDVGFAYTRFQRDGRLSSSTGFEHFPALYFKGPAHLSAILPKNWIPI
jgi:hypothetical protein